MATPHDPDQLLALALARMRRQHLRLIRTHEELLAEAREVRERAAEARQGPSGAIPTTVPDGAVASGVFPSGRGWDRTSDPSRVKRVLSR